MWFIIFDLMEFFELEVDESKIFFFILWEYFNLENKRELSCLKKKKEFVFIICKVVCIYLWICYESIRREKVYSD